MTILGSVSITTTCISTVVSCNPVEPQYPTFFLTYKDWENWNPTIEPIGGKIRDDEARTKYLQWIKDNPMIVLEDCMDFWGPFHAFTDFSEISYSLIDVQLEEQMISIRTYEKSTIEGVSGTITTTYSNIKIEVRHSHGDSCWFWEVASILSEDYLKNDQNWSFECVAEGYNKDLRDYYNTKYNSEIVHDDTLYALAGIEIAKFTWLSHYLSLTEGDE